MINTDSIEYRGRVFHVGDLVHVMTMEEAIAEYGMDDRGRVLLPSGVFDYKRISTTVGGVEFRIARIYQNGEFFYAVSGDDFRTSDLKDFYLSAEVCLPSTSDDDTDPIEIDEDILLNIFL